MSLDYINTAFAFAVVMLLLSLFVSILVQIIVAIGGLRGRNLRWGVIKILSQIPGIKDYAEKIAEQALKHPALISTQKLAKVAGSKELLAVLKDLSQNNNNSLDSNAKDELKKAIENSPPQDVENLTQILVTEFEKLFPEEKVKMDEAVQLVKSKASKLMVDFDTWFDTIMSRSTDRFIAITRWWGIAFGVILAFAFQIDSFDLLKNLSIDAELRSTLVQIGNQTQERAEEILLSKPIAVEAIDSLYKSKNFEKQFKEFVKGENQIPGDLKTRSQGLAWLDEKFQSSDSMSLIQSAFEKEFDKLTSQRLKSLGKQSLEIKNQLELSKLVVLPKDLNTYLSSWKDFWRHIPGILLTALLLSLGAPFWFNTLRTLSSLRPILAGKIDPSKSEK